MAEKFKNLINVEWKDSKNGNTLENRKPTKWNEALIVIFSS